MSEIRSAEAQRQREMYKLMHPDWPTMQHDMKTAPLAFIWRDLFPKLGCASKIPARNLRETAIERYEWRTDTRTDSERLQDEHRMLNALRLEFGSQRNYDDFQERIAMGLPLEGTIKERESRVRRECRSRAVDPGDMFLPL